MPGPAPKKHARFGVGKAGWIALPEEGAQVKAPAWPLDGPPEKGWAALWRKPQAVKWRELGCEDVVARYLVVKNLTQQPKSLDEVNAAALAEVRRFEEALGLSPMALKRLQWEIVPKKVVDQAAKVTSLERFKRL